MLQTILLVFAFVLAIITAFAPSLPPPWPPVQCGWLAFVFFVAAFLFGPMLR